MYMYTLNIKLYSVLYMHKGVHSKAEENLKGGLTELHPYCKNCIKNTRLDLHAFKNTSLFKPVFSKISGQQQNISIGTSAYCKYKLFALIFR